MVFGLRRRAVCRAARPQADQLHTRGGERAGRAALMGMAKVRVPQLVYGLRFDDKRMLER